MKQEITSPAARIDRARPAEPVYEILRPKEQTLPVVLASPHSGRRYTDAFLRQAQLGEVALRRSEDAYVDEIFADAPAVGAPLVKALFPRTFVDANREPLELDADMFWDRLPWRINRTSPRVRSGLGVIARVGANGASIYDAPLSASDARARLRGYYFPYHRALKQLIRRTKERFGYAILIDCHSMPSQAVARTSAGPASSGGRRGVDMVLGDCHGVSCMPQLTESAEAALLDLGYTVVRNSPYAGGFTTRHYGRPADHVHALQIEVNRRLYMDEARLSPAEDGMERLRDELVRVISAVGAIAPFARAAE